VLVNKLEYNLTGAVVYPQIARIVLPPTHKREERPMPTDKENKDAQLSEQTEGELEMKPEVSTTGEAQLPPPASQAPMTESNERTWSMLAHLSILLNLFTGILGPVFALIIYLVYQDDSRYVAYQSLQSTIFQLVVWVGVGLVIGAMWVMTVLLSFIGIGLLCIPFTLLATIFLLAVPLASLVYGIYAAVQCSHGADFRYWLVGDWVRSTYEGA
jgi:uncharacterized Tic20 family protein